MWSYSQAVARHQRNDRKIDDLKTRLATYDHDSQQKIRLHRQRCRACFYLDVRIGGDALTPFDCAACGRQDIAPSTATPRLCAECAVSHAWCQECGGVMD
jgi:hypothetical protein